MDATSFNPNPGAGARSHEQQLCEDILLAILEELPSRSLMGMRSVSRLFLDLTNEILRARFLEIAISETQFLVLESSVPYNSIKPSRQVLVFSHFLESPSPASPLTAILYAPQRKSILLPLEDTEVFGNNILGVTLQSLDIAPMSEEQPNSYGAMPYTRIAGNSSRPPRQYADFSWQLSLAGSLDRLFREWFLPASRSNLRDDRRSHKAVNRDTADDSDEVLSITPSPPSSRGSSPPSESERSADPARESRFRTLQISNHWPMAARCPSAFISCSLECFAHAEAVPPGQWPPRPATGPHTFEYVFESVTLDAAKAVCSAEEGFKGQIRRGERRPFRLFGRG
ncbi:uncharacterized protein JCM15063_003263 [Sporobolomyces koalae]|uniref:uncharacterized protein n=1 Tax=Sporobolomyces koalae TaxID=500713 RepID=UPI00317A124E